jgi:hypothetical protein
MPAVHKLIITRPSLDSLHVSEVLNEPPHYVMSTLPGFISHTWDSITWQELNDRKSELLASRPDIYDQIDRLEIPQIDLNWNPFSLTWTVLSTFDTVEHTIAGIDALFASGFNTSFKQKIDMISGTTATEELWVDGVKDETYNPGRF